MSSPKILTFTLMPLAEARAMNGMEALGFLNQAKTLYERTLEKVNALPVEQASVMRQRMPARYEVVEREARRMLAAEGDLADALRFVHAYWQSLKHPWADEVESAQAAHALESERAETIRREAVRAVLRDLDGASEDTRRRLSRPAGIPVAGDAERVVEVSAALKHDFPQLATRIDAIVATVDPSHATIVLDKLRITVEQEAVRVRRAAVRERLISEQRARFRAEVDARLAIVRAHLQHVGPNEEEPLARELHELMQWAPTGPMHEVERRLDALHAAARTARARMSVATLVRNTLMRMGYDEVQHMETVTAAQLLHFSDARDPDRFVEVVVDESRSLVSIEAVRTQESGTEDAVADKEYAERTCRAVRRLESELESHGDVRVLRETPPGGRLKRRANLARPQAATLKDRPRKLEA